MYLAQFPPVDFAALSSSALTSGVESTRLPPNQSECTTNKFIKPTNFTAHELVMLQIQTAKVQAAEGMAQLGAGRKLLHKHKHDDDHEHDDDDDDDHKKKGGHKHKDEEHDDSDKEEKKEKDGHKKGKHGKKDGKNRAPRDKVSTSAVECQASYRGC